MVTGRKVILFLFVLGSQLGRHQKISVTTKDTAELNEKYIKHNVITTKSIKMALANLCTCMYSFNPRYHGYYAIFCFLPNLHVGGRTNNIQKESFEL